MTFKTRPLPDNETLLCEADGIADAAERQSTLATMIKELSSNKYKYCLVDLQKFSGENNPADEKAFGRSLVSNISMFRGVRVAVVLSPDFRVSSVVVMELQKLGVQIMDFSDMAEAEDWLYADRV